MSDEIRPANNNVPNPDRTIERVLVMTAVVRAHLTGALDKYLACCGATPDFRQSLQTYMAPTLALVDETERDVLAFVRAAKPSLMVGESFDTLLDKQNAMAEGKAPPGAFAELAEDARDAWRLENGVDAVPPTDPPQLSDGQPSSPANENRQSRGR